MVGRVVGTVAFVSLALVPWWVLFFGWSWWVLVALLFWLVVGVVALFDPSEWERRRQG